jgi:predicted  nucleic acid-binding Zn-ribbon protein
MKFVVDFIGDNPMVVYIVGMSLVVILAGIFCLSIWYYIKAKELAPRLRTIKTLEDAIDRLRKDILEKEQKLRDLQPKIVEAELKIERGRQAEEWLKKAKEEIETTQKLLAAIREEFERAKVQLEDLKRQISERQQQLVELEKKAVEAEKSIEDLRKENGELTVQVPRLRAEKAEIDKEIEAAKAEKEKLETERRELSESVAEVKGELERLNGQIASKKDDLGRITEEVGKIRGEVSALKGEANVAREVIAELANRRKEQTEKWKNLDAPVVNEGTLRKADETVDEKKWLEDFTKSLDPHGFVFDERAIRAFHTGLKCATHTPLVVLAGISGTGKSLLPELYSAALGANFLSVPVQPRWDSPQDLFGFYNYMEGRYKATELARLLWQFDIYNNPVAMEKWKSGGLPLNLVLLDEMNIARVEYYFSDLLSKLETRNGINAGKSEERRKAEIELECNAADDVKAMRRLFVSPHTLFVGTMNEDESTQMLSDKVIDRSNVLRFGRPGILANAKGKTQCEPDKSGFVGEWENGKRRLSANVWDKWCVSLAAATDGREDMRFLRDTLLPVGEALDGVGRAYGFRVDQAMKLYVLNYPGNYREAVSDQIEMKILPKLNGMELQNPHFATVKQAISDAIAKTSDMKLQIAFDEACRQDMGATFFKWRGVMR